jgi:hypothetical protein
VSAGSVLYCSTIACRKDIINLITLTGVKKAIFCHFLVLNAFVRFFTFGFFRQKNLPDHLNCFEKKIKFVEIFYMNPILRILQLCGFFFVLIEQNKNTLSVSIESRY